MKSAMKALAAALWLTFCGPVFGRQAPQTPAEYEIMARHQERIGDRVLLTGSVRIVYKQLRLFADHIELDVKTKDVLARGNVTLHLPDEVLSAEEIEFNLDSQRGELVRVHGLVQPSITYEAESVERVDNEIYRLNKAWITSCTQTVPRWRFSCTRADFKKNDYVALWNAVFRIKRIPVFYLPYMRYPVGEERATGFLMPQVGYNGRKGLTYTQGFYWSILRNMDATFNFDYYSARGLGGGLEYRYLLPKGAGGQINLFFFNFNNQEQNPDDPERAYILRLKHNQALPFDFQLVADVDYQSSFDFLREFDNNFMRAVVSNRRSQLYLSRYWSSFNLNVRASRFETYFMQSERSIIRNTIPEVAFTSNKIKLVEPFYFSLSSAFSAWEYGWDSDFEKNTQKKSQNLTFRPSLTVPFNSIPWLTVNSTASAQLAYYFQSYAPGTTKVVPEPLLSRNLSLNLELVGPVFYRIFSDSKNEPKVKHLVEPTFTYRYESPVSGSDRIITARFFYLNHYLTYGLVNRLYIKQNEMPREIITLGLNQTFYFDPEQSPLQIYEVDGEIPEYSDITGYLRFYPSRRYSLDFSTGFNPYHRTFSSLRLGANLGNPQDDLFLRVNWYKSINPYREEALWSRHQIGFSGGAKIPALGIEARADVDYNIHERELLYTAASAIFHYQCLDFKADLRIFYFRDKPEVQFQFSLGLGNIGKTTHILHGFDVDR